MERRIEMRPWGVVITLVLGLFIFAWNALGGEQLKHRYYLLAETGHQPMCVVDIHVNDEHIIVIEPEVKKEIIEVTSFLEVGENEVVFEAEALPEEGDDYGTIDIKIGSGTYKDGNLSWEALNISYSMSRAKLKKEGKEIMTTSLKFSAN